MTIKNFVFNPFQVNTFILSDETGECVIIDAACYASQEEQILENYITGQKLKPVLLLNTHCHIDHILGNRFVKERYGIDTAASEHDAFLLDSAGDFARNYGFEIEDVPALDRTVGESDTVQFGNSRLDILHVPGHSPGSLVFHSNIDKFIIAGDVLFRRGIGRSDLPGGNHKLLIQSIKNKLFTLHDSTVVYPGHGEKTTIGEEKRENPFF